MIVVDASSLVELITCGPGAPDVGSVLAADGEWCAPEHFTVEAVSALRGLWLGGQLSAETFAMSAEQVAGARISTYRTGPLIGRMIELAGRATAYDSAYVALAETLDCPLVTLDQRLRSLTGITCRFLPESS
jgi:predicted nucleic acid-binding protein